MRRPLPDLPWLSRFPELNVRTYVEAAGKPGVWFLSLDATNPLAVWAARRYFHLPYFLAQMRLHRHGETISYSSARNGARFRGAYQPVSQPYLATPGTLDHWLTERYCLYAQGPDGSLLRNDIHHAPWPLQRATANIEENSMLARHGLEVGGPPAHLCFARRVDVVVWGAERVQ